MARPTSEAFERFDKKARKAVGMPPYKKGRNTRGMALERKREVLREHAMGEKSKY